MAALHLLLQHWPEDAAQPLRRQDGRVLQTPLHVPVHCIILWGKGNRTNACHYTKKEFSVVVFVSPFFKFALSSFPLAQMGRCDNCRKQSYLTEKLQCLGSVRNFCNLPCLLQYCYMHFETSQHTSSNGPRTTPQAPHGKSRYVILVLPDGTL